MGTPFKLKKGNAKKALKTLFNSNGIKKGVKTALGNGFVKGPKKVIE